MEIERKARKSMTATIPIVDELAHLHDAVGKLFELLLPLLAEGGVPQNLQ